MNLFGSKTGLSVRRLFRAGMLALSIPFIHAEDKSTPSPPKTWGSAYYAVGPGFFARGGGGAGLFSHSSLGVEVYVFRGLAVGGDIGVLRGGNCCLVQASLNPVYHFSGSRLRSKGLAPFVTAGFTAGSPEQGISVKGLNVGGGVTWWFRNRFGLRAELRDYIFPLDHVNYLAFRFGISFR